MTVVQAHTEQELWMSFARIGTSVRAVVQRSAFGWSTAGNDVVATILISLFSALHSSLLLSAVTFSHTQKIISLRIQKREKNRNK